MIYRDPRAQGVLLEFPSQRNGSTPHSDFSPPPGRRDAERDKEPWDQTRRGASPLAGKTSASLALECRDDPVLKDNALRRGHCG